MKKAPLNSLESLHSSLLNWFQLHQRDLPWRRNRDPYRIWLSEIMLQQTRVETVLPYFEKFTRKYPNVHALARADVDELRAMWAGLGYYSRVMNLHRAAQKVVTEHNGKIPESLEELRELPGIGSYTAAAIASIAFGANVAAIDGNLERVLARVLALQEVAKGSTKLRLFADSLMAIGEAGQINQALMDISATICKPKNPQCLLCPVQKFCQAYLLQLRDSIPVKKPKRGFEELSARGVILLQQKSKSNLLQVLLARRPSGSWLAGMWDIPWWIEDGDPTPDLRVSFQGSAEVRRTITHHKITFRVDYAVLTKSAKIQETNWDEILRRAGDEFSWVTLTEDSGLPRPTQKVLAKVRAALNLN